MPIVEAQPTAVQRVAFVSLGCPKNLVDSEKMLGLLAEDGIAITDNFADADAIVVNTCGFLEASKVEAMGIIREAADAKTDAATRGETKRLVVAGCLVQRHRTDLLAGAPEIDALVGVFDRENIVKAVRGDFAAVPDEGANLGQFHPVTTFISKHDRTKVGYTESDRARLRLTPRHYAYLRVSEGCNQGCTFCTIPSIRGRMRSKPLADILSEAEELFADGVFELNLIGQDTTSYGADIGYSGAGEGLSGLLRTLGNLPDAGWVRLLYAYPSSFTDEMIDALAAAPKIVKYIDMPLQHINDQVLHAMRRKVTRKQTETLLEKLRNRVPGITLRTTFISGFPGETDAQHQELLAFIRDFGFDCLGVFEYSPELETPAGRLWKTHAVGATVAARRKQEIMLAQQEIVAEKGRQFVGRIITVLVDESDRKRRAALARHAGQAPDIDGNVIVRGVSAWPGEVLQVEVEAADGYDLVGRPVGPKTRSAARPGKVSLPVVTGGR